MILNDLKLSTQCAMAAKTAQTVVGQLAKSAGFHYRDRHNLVRLCKWYVRPHIEYSTKLWMLWMAADKKILEKVQKRAVRIMSGLRETEHEARMKEFGPDTLEA